VPIVRTICAKASTKWARDDQADVAPALQRGVMPTCGRLLTGPQVGIRHFRAKRAGLWTLREQLRRRFWRHGIHVASCGWRYEAEARGLSLYDLLRVIADLQPVRQSPGEWAGCGAGPSLSPKGLPHTGLSSLG
jgi:hypothetical protein